MGVLEGVWRPLGDVLSGLGGIWEPSWALLETSGGLLGTAWAVLEAIVAVLGALGSVLGVSWRRLGGHVEPGCAKTGLRCERCKNTYLFWRMVVPKLYKNQYFFKFFG